MADVARASRSGGRDGGFGRAARFGRDDRTEPVSLELEGPPRAGGQSLGSRQASSRVAARLGERTGYARRHFTASRPIQWGAQDVSVCNGYALAHWIGGGPRCGRGRRLLRRLGRRRRLLSSGWSSTRRTAGRSSPLPMPSSSAYPPGACRRARDASNGSLTYPRVQM